MEVEEKEILERYQFWKIIIEEEPQEEDGNLECASCNSGGCPGCSCLA